MFQWQISSFGALPSQTINQYKFETPRLLHRKFWEKVERAMSDSLVFKLVRNWNEHIISGIGESSRASIDNINFMCEIWKQQNDQRLSFWLLLRPLQHENRHSLLSGWYQWQDLHFVYINRKFVREKSQQISSSFPSHNSWPPTLEIPASTYTGFPRTNSENITCTVQTDLTMVAKLMF